MAAPVLSGRAAPQANLVADLIQEIRELELRAIAAERDAANRLFDIRALEALVQAKEAEAAEIVARERAAAEERVMAIYRSRTWRIMGPYRRAARLARRLLRRG